MIEYEQVDQTILAIMEIYRRQVTDLKTDLFNERQECESLREDARRKTGRIEDLERHIRQRESDNGNLRDTIVARDSRITKLEDIVESLKIELQDARAATTAAKEDRPDHTT